MPMSSIVYLRNKKTGKVYAYLNESEWDPETKRCRCKRKCLGHVDPDTGDIIPNRGHDSRDYATVSSVGVCRFLEHISESIGLKAALNSSIPDRAALLLSCVYYIVSNNRDMALIPFWSVDNVTPYRRPITREVLSDVLSSISENDLFAFFREWRDRSPDSRFYTLHTTSRSSFDSRSETIRFNDLPDLDMDTDTYMYLVYGSESKIPVAYSPYSGPPKGITDLRRRMNGMLWLDFPAPMHIMDRDYCNQENFVDLLKANERFVMRAPPDFPFAREAILRVKDSIMDTKNMVSVDGAMIFAMSFINYQSGKKCFAHIIFSAEEAEREFSVFLGLIEQCYRELLSNTYVDDHRKYYERYFIVTETNYGRSVERNGEAIMSYSDIAGFMTILSNSVKDPVEAYRYFVQRERVQKYYENMRNTKDSIALKLYSDDVYRGRIFVQFLATIVVSEILHRMSSTVLLRNLSFRELIHEMSSVTKVSIPGFDTPFYTNLNNKQLRILKAFGMDQADLRG